MTPPSPTPAEATAAVVLRAVQTGVPLCIPGAIDVRVGQPASRPAASLGVTRAAEKDARTAPDLERREYERAGGGAPSERGVTRHANVIDRLCQLLRRPTGPR
jgi:hypothetical protein